MDEQQEQRNIFKQESQVNDYQWIDKNEYDKLTAGFVHDQSAKIRMGIKNDNSCFKIQQKLTKNGKSYELNGAFCTWNLLRPKNNENQIQNLLFSKRLVSDPSLILTACKNNLKVEWRAGERVYKNFKYNPFISLQTPKDIQDLNVTLGLIHKSKHLNFLTNLTSSIMHSADFVSKIRLQYGNDQIYFGLASQFTQGMNCKLNRSFLGYQFSPRDYFYLSFKVQNMGQLMRGRQTYQQVGFYYLRKINQDLKFALGVKSTNSIQNTLSLVVQTKTPHQIKVKIDSKLNVCGTIRKQISQNSSISYGIGVNNLFQKKSRVQTGLVYEYNA